ncbi:Nsr1p, partial [Reticulomyxa filosa]
ANNSMAVKRMKNRWRNELNSISLDQSSFGKIFEMRSSVMKSLFQHFEQQQRSRPFGASLSSSSSLPSTSSSSSTSPSNAYMASRFIRANAFKNDLGSVKVPVKFWEQIPGHDPTQWPEHLDDFVNNMATMPNLDLYSERRHLLKEFFEKGRQRIGEIGVDLKLKGKMISALLAFAIRLGSPVFVLAMVEILNDYQKELDEKVVTAEQKAILFPNPKTFVKMKKSKKSIDNNNNNNNNEVLSLKEQGQGQQEQEQDQGWMASRLRVILRDMKREAQELEVCVPHRESMESYAFIQDAGYRAALAERHEGADGRTYTGAGGRHQRISSGRGFTTDGRFLYVHCSRGLIKIDTGHVHARKWRFTLARSYRNNEQVQLVWIDGKLYARSPNMQPGVVEVIDTHTLHKLEDVHLGVNFDTSVASRWRSKDLPIMTDGLYLYVASYEHDWNGYYDQTREMRKEIMAKKKQKQKQTQTQTQTNNDKTAFAKVLSEIVDHNNELKELLKEINNNCKETQTDLETSKDVPFDAKIMDNNVGRETINKVIRMTVTERLGYEQQLYKKRLSKVLNDKKGLVDIVEVETGRQSRHVKKYYGLNEVEENTLRNTFGTPKRLVLYAYDVSRADHISVPDIPIGEPLVRTAPEHASKLQKRILQAYALSKKSKYAYDPYICYKALCLTNDNESKAIQWFSTNREQPDTLRKVAPLARYIVCQSTPIVATETNENMFTNCLFYCSGHQLVVLIPPHIQPWNSSDKHVGRVYNLKDGSFIQDVKDIKFHNNVRFTRLSIDPLNNLIWGISIANDFVIQSFANHGPGAYFYEMADAITSQESHSHSQSHLQSHSQTQTQEPSQSESSKQITQKEQAPSGDAKQDAESDNDSSSSGGSTSDSSISVTDSEAEVDPTTAPPETITNANANTNTTEQVQVEPIVPKDQQVTEPNKDNNNEKKRKREDERRVQRRSSKYETNIRRRATRTRYL